MAISLTTAIYFWIVWVNCSLYIIKISKIRTKPNTILQLTSLAMSSVKIWEKFVKTRRRITRLKISNCRKMFRGKIEFEYYIFNIFLIAAKCILLNNSVASSAGNSVISVTSVSQSSVISTGSLCSNNSARFQHFSFKLCQIVMTSLVLSWKPIKKI